MTVRDEWRWTDDRGVQRLVGTEELRAALASSVLPPSTLVWREGMAEWAPASTVPELGGVAADTAQDARPKTPADASRASRRSCKNLRSPIHGLMKTNGSTI